MHKYNIDSSVMMAHVFVMESMVQTLYVYIYIYKQNSL